MYKKYCKIWLRDLISVSLGSGVASGAGALIVDERLAWIRNEKWEMRNGGAAPDPSTQFSLFRLYMIEHPTFHSAQDDEMRREV